MLQGEHSAILLTCIKQKSALKKKIVFYLSGRLRQVLLYFLCILVFSLTTWKTRNSIIDLTADDKKQLMNDLGLVPYLVTDTKSPSSTDGTDFLGWTKGQMN